MKQPLPLSRHPSAREGQLSQWKAHLVTAAHLHQCAVALELSDYLLLGKGEERNGGRERRTLLANALEAIIAAIYLDGGMKAARAFVEENVLFALDSPEDVDSIGLLNHKSVLQEKTQALGLPVPRYSTHRGRPPANVLRSCFSSYWRRNSGRGNTPL